MSLLPDSTVKSWIESTWIKHQKLKVDDGSFVETDEMEYPAAITGFVWVDIDGVPTKFSVKVRKVE